MSVLRSAISLRTTRSNDSNATRLPSGSRRGRRSSASCLQVSGRTRTASLGELRVTRTPDFAFRGAMTWPTPLARIVSYDS